MQHDQETIQQNQSITKQELEDSFAMLNLVKEIHQTNIEKGFWPEPKLDRNKAEALALTCGELYEALEAHKKRGFAAFFERDVQQAKSMKAEDAYHNLLQHTFEEEIADALIRFYDFCQGFNIEIRGNAQQVILEYPELAKEMNVGGQILILAGILSKANEYLYITNERGYDQFVHQLHAFHACIRFLCDNRWNLHYIEEVIKLKFAYNKTRQAKHGKRY